MGLQILLDSSPPTEIFQPFTIVTILYAMATAIMKYSDVILMGNNTAEQITVKRALYTARVRRPGGNTTLVKHLSESAALASQNCRGHSF